MTDETPPADDDKRRLGAYRGENHTIWDKPAVDLLTTMVRSKVDTGIIADRFKVTRSAIIGKAHRLGLVVGKPRAPKGSPHAKVRGERRPRSQLPAYQRLAEQVISLPLPEIDDIPAIMADEAASLGAAPLGKSLIELGPNDCKWPIGDPQQAGFHFCGKRGLSGVPYCVGHARIAYQTRDTTNRGRSKW